MRDYLGYRGGFVVRRGEYRMKTLVHLSPLAAVGGCEINCLRIIENLRGYRHHVLVFSERDKMSETWSEAGADVEHLGAWNAPERSSFGDRLASWVKSRSDVAGVFYWSTSRLPVVLDSIAEWQCPCAVYLGNPVPGGIVERLRLLTTARRTRSERGVQLVACSALVAASHRAAPYFKRFPVRVIHNAVGAQYDRARSHRDPPIGKQSGDRHGGRASTPSSDQLTIIRAVAGIRPRRDDIVVEFAGDGERLGVLRAEGAAPGCGFPHKGSWAASSDVPERLCHWDLYLHSTTAAEGMGTAVAEAMTTGTPCLVSDLPVMREVCGEFGAHYAPASDAQGWGRAILSLLADTRRRTELGLAAQVRARRLFDPKYIARCYEETLLSESKAGVP